MNTFLKTSLFSFVLSLFFGLNSHAVDLGQIEQGLKTTGVVGWIHGAAEDQKLYVFTYRNPDNFFDSIQMSLVAEGEPMEKLLASFGRHDKVRIKGNFLKNPSPQKHILLTSIELVEKFKSGYPSDPYPHDAKIPDELRNLTHATFLVHAVAGDGHILVLEYKDSIVPVFVKKSELAKNLYRNDLIELQFKILEYPDQPSHLKLDESAPTPIEILESIKDLHGKTGTVEGALILFPKSPDIIFNVFAVEQPLRAGLHRQFTLLNFEDPALFKKIRDTLQAAWDRHPGAYTNGRNKLLSTSVKVKVSGVFNEVDPSQANPQVLIQKIEDLQVIE